MPAASIPELLSFSAAEHPGPGEEGRAVGARGCASPWLPGRDGTGPRRGCDRVRRCSGAQPRPGSPRPGAANTALLRGSARRFDPREVSGTDTRAPATCAPAAAPGAARPPRPALLTLGGARLCRPLSPPLLTPWGGERERELAGCGRVRSTILASPCFPGDSERACQEVSIAVSGRSQPGPQESTVCDVGDRELAISFLGHGGLSRKKCDYFCSPLKW